MEFVISKNGAEAKVTTKGAVLTSFVCGGKEYVWCGDAKYWSGQAPCLFPVVCRPLNDKVSFDGVEYPMTKHGFVRNAEFTVVEVCPDKVVLQYCANEETKKMYPFDFNLKVTQSVTENSFTTAYTVENKGDVPMPFCIGGHPAFNCPMNEGESFSDYSLIFEDAEGATDVNVDLPEGYRNPANKPLGKIVNNELKLVYSDYDNDAIIIEGLNKNSVKLVNRESGKGIKFDFDSFDCIGIWTPIKADAPFVCLEPWNGVPAGIDETSEFMTKKYARLLAPGQSFTTSYTATVID